MDDLEAVTVTLLLPRSLVRSEESGFVQPACTRGEGGAFLLVDILWSELGEVVGIVSAEFVYSAALGESSNYVRLIHCTVGPLYSVAVLRGS